MEERGIAQGVGPQREVHHCGPSSPSVQKLLACTLREVTNAVFGDTVLEVGVDATKGKLLTQSSWHACFKVLSEKRPLLQ